LFHALVFGSGQSNQWKRAQQQDIKPEHSRTAQLDKATQNQPFGCYLNLHQG